MRPALVAIVGSVLMAASAAQGGFPVTVSDALGRTVTVRREPGRIISLAPSITEILFALGLDARIGGLSDADDFPPGRVAGKPRVGGAQLNVEAVVGLHPDLILGLVSLQRGQLDRLIELHLPVVALDARSLEDIEAQIQMIGRLTGRETAAQQLLAGMRTRVAAVASAVRGRRPPRVYVEIWGEPLMGAGGGTFADDVLRRAGGANIFSDLAGWPLVAAEAVIRRNPEVIVLTYRGRAGVLARRGWSQIAAVRSGRVIEVDAALVSRPGPRIVLGLEHLARILHPEVLK